MRRLDGGRRVSSRGTEIVHRHLHAHPNARIFRRTAPTIATGRTYPVTHRRLQQGGPAGGGLSLGPSYRMGDPGIEPSPRTPYIEPPPAVGEWGANRVMSRVLPPVNAVRAAIVRPPPLIGGGGCLPPARGRGLSFR